MKLSIIIPSYNTKKMLKECIHSIYRQTKALQYEVIVVDNASDYNIKKQVQDLRQEHKRMSLKLLVNKKNLGFAKACNQGLKQAKGELILYLNSDTIIIDKSLQKVVNILDSDKKISILGCQLRNPDTTIQPSVGFFPKLKQIIFMMLFLDDLPFIKKIIKPFHQNSKLFYEHTHEVDWVTGAFLLCRKEVLKKIGGFDEDFFMYAEEVDFCFRAKKAGFRVFYTPQASILHYKEASPRPVSRKAILAEFKGLKIYFKKHKPAWEMPFLRLFLKIGALLRVFVFGILYSNENKKKIYLQAYNLA